MTIDDLYKQNMGYWSSYGQDVVICIVIIAITVAIVSYSMYQSILLKIKTNWNTNKCNPIFMPFAGQIMPQPGKTSAETTVDNFSYCLKQDVSMVFSIAMMPLEFALYMIIEVIDTILNAFVAFMRLMAWLKAQLGGIFATIYNTIVSFLVPLIEMMIHIRDTIAKVNGVLVSALFTAMTVYNITVSGILNIMHILNVVMLIFCSVIVALVIFAFILMFNPFTAIVGVAAYVSATLVIVTFIIPTIVIYIMMLVFMQEVTHTVADNAPSAPSVKKRK